MSVGSPVLPALYNAADAASSIGQRTFLALRGGQLLALLVGAIGGVVVVRVQQIDAAGLLVVAAFLSVAGLQYWLSQADPQRSWYDGRAAAESVKTLAWRYAVRAAPFQGDADSDGVFVAQLAGTLKQLGHLALPAGGTEQITGWMRALRSEPLESRRETYKLLRIDEQHTWYADRAETSRRMTTAWRIALSALAVLGALGGVAKTLLLIDINLVGLAATAVTGSAAWLETRQHETLAVAYGLTAQELASAAALINGPTDEEAWSDFVNDCEAAISREHTTWRASRTARGGRR